MKQHRFHPNTESVRGGDGLEKRNAPVVPPIYQTSTFQVVDSEEQVRVADTDMYYTRYGNPTHTVVEKAIAQLEGADSALLFASGMNAITTSILALVKSGDHIVAQRDLYGGPVRTFAENSSIATRKTDVAFSSRSLGCRASSHRPGRMCSERARSAVSFSSGSSTSVAFPRITTER